MFTDTEFPADIKCIGNIDSPLPSNLQFLRAHEFMSEVHLYEGGIEPLDIKQGCLGDCYFLSALAALAEFPKRIEKMIKMLGNGKYQVTFYYMGREQNIIVDDIFPCNNGFPYFSHNNGNELWVMLLEKAYAKVAGSYSAIEGGIPFLALSDLTGMPVKRIIKLSELDQNILFKKINSYDKKKYCMVASVPDVPGVDLVKECGLIEDHAYTVIDAYEINGHRLLKIRNPWGCGEWKGKWRDDDPAWTPEMKQQLNIVEADDGLFFMEMDDFVKHFEDITILYYHEDWKYFNSIEVNMTEKQMTVEFSTDGECIATISQQRNENKIAFRMWGIDDKGQAIGGNTDEAFVITSNCRGKKMKLSSGKYKMVVETHLSCVSKLPYKFNISFSSKNPVTIGEITPIPASDKIPFMTKQSCEGAETCKGCGQPLPAKGIAKTKIGNFHLKCFKCDECGAQLGGKFKLKGTKKLCIDCGQK